MPRIRGAFEVKMTPQPRTEGVGEASVGLSALDKVFHGDLDGTSKGQMLGFFNAELKSGGYVAMERVTGTLVGRAGSFLLQHNTMMTRGAPDLEVRIVPDSGTDALAGVTGTMQIIIEPGSKHFYELEFELPA
jgi:hypothetical protein